MQPAGPLTPSHLILTGFGRYSGMSQDHSGLGRLLPRHPVNLDAPIRWDLHQVRRLIGRSRETSKPGRLLNLSLEGALIEVPLPTERHPGDRLVISMGDDRRGAVEIRHSRLAKSGDRMLYGVTFVEASALTGIISELVATARGDRAKLANAWENAR